MRRLPAVVLAALLLGGAAACAAEEPGRAVVNAMDSGSATNASGGTSHGAPEVSLPALDAQRYLPAPCSVLSTDQLLTFSVTRPGVPTTEGPTAEIVGPYCSWFSDDQPYSRSFSVGYLVGNENGLSDTYRGRDEGQFAARFEPTEVSGYPAVFTDGVDGRKAGRCTLTVGISNSFTFQAGETSGPARGEASCEGARELAEAVIATLRTGS